ncbi:sulfhydryl oxidase 1 isoform X1 [Alligator sinensis]|uniref:Sulfhydryl oxidase n=1 Tax=Alligator sinensis TaxID=38654 RepID=A0A1U7SQS6_ALLSI|nr:sulfhydryl oxidase 1 isoform X1 [Alligator sinensis]
MPAPVIPAWRPAVAVGAVDCQNECKTKECGNFDVPVFPTLRVFKPNSTKREDGKDIDAIPDVSVLRQSIITNLEKYMDPSLGLKPAHTEEVHGFFQKNNVMYLALIFEKNDSFVGREVILDMQQYENIAVRRVLSSEKKLVEEYNVTAFPSAYLLSSNGSSAIKVQEETRSSYTSFLRDRSGSNKKTLMLKVQNEITPPPSRVPDAEHPTEATPWKYTDRSKLYMADLESVLHCSLRVNKAKFPVLKGEQLETLKRYVAVLAKYFPKHDSLNEFLYSLDNSLENLKESNISHSDLEDVLKKSNPPAVLRKKARWMGCQGSKPHYRGYSCSVWVLFHLLTVQASQYAKQDADPLEVLQTMREFMHHFYYCRDCSKHFEGMAKESMDQVKSRDEAILWLWERHNTVNMRVKNQSNEDPKFPKTLWPPSNLCPLCHNNLSESPWNKTEVLSFLQRHYSLTNIENDELTRHRREVDEEAHMKGKDHRLLGYKGEERGWNKSEQEEGEERKAELVDIVVKREVSGLKRQTRKAAVLATKKKQWMNKRDTILLSIADDGHRAVHYATSQEYLRQRGL